MVDTLMTAGEVARELERSHTRILQLARSGELPVAAKTAGGMHLFRLADVDAYRAYRAERQQPRQPVEAA
jgi:hypothetical protein